MKSGIYSLHTESYSWLNGYIPAFDILYETGDIVEATFQYSNTCDDKFLPWPKSLGPLQFLSICKLSTHLYDISQMANYAPLSVKIEYSRRTNTDSHRTFDRPFINQR